MAGVLWHVKGIDQESDDDAQKPEVPSMTYMPYRVTAIDRCPAGYRIIWSEPPPYALRGVKLLA